MRREARPIFLAAVSAFMVSCSPAENSGGAPRVRIESVDPEQSRREMARQSQEMCDARFRELSPGIAQSQAEFEAGYITERSHREHRHWFCQDMRTACEDSPTVPAGAADCFPPTIVEMTPPVRRDE